MDTNKSLSKGSCILRIKGVYDSLKSAEKRLADFVLDNPKETVNSTMEELAEKSQSSYATIFRFCKKVGYSGYKDFKSSLIHDVMTNKNIESIIEDFSLGKNATTQDVCEKIYDFSHKILQDSMSMIDLSVIDKVVDRILNSKSVCFIGAGTSGVSAKYAYTKFFRLGVPCFSETDPTLYKMKASILTEGDLLFAISSSGRTENVVKAARIAKKNNAYVISLSDFAISPLTKTSDINLYTTPRNASLFLDIEMPLIIGQITILDILYSCCCVRLGEKASDMYSKTKHSADEEKLQS